MECAWQESNLLPHAPQACALSGELQARGLPELGSQMLILVNPPVHAGRGQAGRHRGQMLGEEEQH